MTSKAFKCKLANLSYQIFNLAKLDIEKPKFQLTALQASSGPPRNFKIEGRNCNFSCFCNTSPKYLLQQVESVISMFQCPLEHFHVDWDLINWFVIYKLCGVENEFEKKLNKP